MKKLLLLIVSCSLMLASACSFLTAGNTSSSENANTESTSSVVESSVPQSESSKETSTESSEEATSSEDVTSSEETSSSEEEASSEETESSEEDSSAKKETYTITFKQEGEQDVVKTVEEGQPLTDIPTPKAITGYNVVWDVTDFSKITQNMTVTAVVTAKTYTITYTLGSRANDSYAKLDNAEQEVKYDKEYTLEAPTCEGYIFAGWLIEGTETILEAGTWNIDKDVTLVAQWNVDPSSDRDHTGRY